MIDAAVASPTSLVLVSWDRQGCPAVPTGLRYTGRRQIQLTLSDAWPPSRTCSPAIVATTFVLAVDRHQVDASRGLRVQVRGAPPGTQRNIVAPYRPDVNLSRMHRRTPTPTASAP